MHKLISLSTYYTSFRIVPLNLTDATSMEMIVEEAERAFGHVDILMLAAGILHFGYLKNVSKELDQKIMEVNYSGQRELLRLLLPGEPFVSLCLIITCNFVLIKTIFPC